MVWQQIIYPSYDLKLSVEQAFPRMGNRPPRTERSTPLEIKIAVSLIRKQLFVGRAHNLCPELGIVVNASLNYQNAILDLGRYFEFFNQQNGQ